MLSRLSGLFYSRTKGWRILILIIAFVVFEAITLPVLKSAPGGKIVSLDAQFFYTPEKAFSVIASYGNTKNFWIFVYLSWDIINPVLYTLIFSLLISWLFQRSFKPGNKLYKLNILPVGAGFFDLLENICIVTLLIMYPAQFNSVAWLGTICTMSKMSFLGISTLLILVGLVKAATNKLKVMIN